LCFFSPSFDFARCCMFFMCPNFDDSPTLIYCGRLVLADA
jgi:hypothetical protein